MRIGRYGRKFLYCFGAGYMKLEDFKDKSVEQLQNSLMEFKKEAFNLRFQKANGQLDNTSRVRIVRRSVAKIMTLMKQKAQKG